MISDWSCTHLGERQHDEGAAAAGVHDHGHELGVDGAEVAVPGHLGDTNVIVTLVGLQRLAEDVAELAGAHDAPRHGGLQGGNRGGGVQVFISNFRFSLSNK